MTSLRHIDVEKTKTVLNKNIVRVFLYKDSISKHADFYKRILINKGDFDAISKNSGAQLFFGISKDKTITELMNQKNFYEKVNSLFVFFDSFSGRFFTRAF